MALITERDWAGNKLVAERTYDTDTGTVVTRTDGVTVTEVADPAKLAQMVASRTARGGRLTGTDAQIKARLTSWSNQANRLELTHQNSLDELQLLVERFGAVMKYISDGI
jgi:hypothetical protein